MSEVKENILAKVGNLTERMGERGLERLLDIGEGMAIMKEITEAANAAQQQNETEATNNG